MKNLKILALLLCMSVGADRLRLNTKENVPGLCISAPVSERNKFPVSAFSKKIYDNGVKAFQARYSKQSFSEIENVFFIAATNSNTKANYIDKLIKMDDKQLRNEIADKNLLRYEIVLYAYKYKNSLPQHVKYCIEEYVDKAYNQDEGKRIVLKRTREIVESGKAEKFTEDDWYKEMKEWSIMIYADVRYPLKKGIFEYFRTNEVTRGLRMDDLERVMQKYFKHDEYLQLAYAQIQRQHVGFMRSFYNRFRSSQGTVKKMLERLYLIQDAKGGCERSKFRVESMDEQLRKDYESGKFDKDIASQYEDKEEMWAAWKPTFLQYKRGLLALSQYSSGSVAKEWREVIALGGSLEREYEILMEILRDFYDIHWANSDVSTEERRAALLEKLYDDEEDIPEGYFMEKYGRRHIKVKEIKGKIEEMRDNLSDNNIKRILGYSAVCERKPNTKTVEELIEEKRRNITDSEIEELVWKKENAIKSEEEYISGRKEENERDFIYAQKNNLGTSRIYAEAIDAKENRKEIAQTLVLFDQAEKEIREKEEEKKISKEEMEEKIKELVENGIKVVRVIRGTKAKELSDEENREIREEVIEEVRSRFPKEDNCC